MKLTIAATASLFALALVLTSRPAQAAVTSGDLKSAMTASSGVVKLDDKGKDDVKDSKDKDKRSKKNPQDDKDNDPNDGNNGKGNDGKDKGN